MEKNSKNYATKVDLRGEVTHMAEASEHIGTPGQAVIVNRGCVRSIVFSCPDGCGETLTVNLDPRAGKAWRLYRTKHGLTIFPSVWRDNGCRSHFIVWRDQIFWMNHLPNEDGQSYGMYAANSELDALVFKALNRESARSYIDIADDLGEIPWDILQSCERLVGQNKARRGQGQQRDFFRLI